MSTRLVTGAGEKETGRIEAFSDGVFAIATTLLILEIRVPPHHPGQSADELVRSLLGLWPSYLAYLTGFSTIVIMWINHHRLFSLIRRSSHALLVWNSLLLLVITFVPFPTALVAEYIDQGGYLPNVAAMVYSGTSVLIAVFYNLLWWHMSGNNRLIDSRADPKAVAAISRSYALGPVAYLVALGAAFYSAFASLGICLLLAVFFALPNGGGDKLPVAGSR